MIKVIYTEGLSAWCVRDGKSSVIAQPLGDWELTIPQGYLFPFSVLL